MKSVLYYVIPDKIINGTLFYAMEYFLVLNEIEPTNLVLKCDEKTFNFILECFHIKYDYNTNLDKLIKFTNKYTSLTNMLTNKVLILDTDTFKKCSSLIKHEIFLYIHSDKINITPPYYNYGFYNYQSHRFTNRLKLALQYHKKYDEMYDEFNSSITMRDSKGKQGNKFLNLMLVKNWKYTHNGFDTNNRFIIEARYHEKVLSYSIDKKFKDSITDRLSVNLNDIILTKTDMIIKDFTRG